MTLNEVNNTGGKVGPRMARIVSDALVYTRQRLGPHQAGLAQKVLADFTNHVSDEVRGVMRPVWLQFADGTDTPDHIRPLFRSLANERGQAWGWIAGAATGSAVGSSVGDLFSNLLAPVVQSLIAQNPNALLSPEVIAQVIAKGIPEDIRDIVPVDEAEKGGLSGDRLRYLVELARLNPSVNELQTMFNRGALFRDDFAEALQRMGFHEKWRKRLMDLSESDVSLADISAMWNRSVVTTDEANSLGKRIGYNETQVRRALEIGGEPLAPGQLGEAFRRGFINSTRYMRGIVQGPIRNEWFDVVEKLQFARMSVVDAASAVTQGHMTESEGKRVAHENGLVPEDFSTLVEISGRPPGVEFAQEALNRGVIDRAQFRTMFLESAIKNKYVALLETMRTRLLPQETARLAYREGVYTREQTLDTLLKHGFTAADAATLVSLEDARRNETTKELTRAQIVDLYDEHVIEKSMATELLLSLGYNAENVELMLALAEIKRTQRFINAAITRVRSAYVLGKIPEHEASAQLDRLGLLPEQRDENLAIWDIDRLTVTKTLTPAQIRQAFKREMISGDEALARLVAQGYDGGDATLFLQLTA